MQRTRLEFDRFLRRAHRRWVAWRALERVGLSLLGACALSLPLIAICWMQGEPALGAVALALALGASVGAVWGVLHRPTLLDTAIEADRQFNLHDLLGTALTLSRCAYADHAARATITARADERCRRLASSRLILNKLGARAWGGIGLATALVMTLALMTTSPAPTVARADEGEQPFASTAAPQLRTTAQGVSRTSIQPDVAAPARSSDSDSPLARSDDVIGTKQPSPTGAPTNALISRDGAGSSSGQSDARHTGAPLPVAPRTDRATGSIPAGGAGDPAARGDVGEGPATSGQTRSTQSNAAPWHSSTWDADRARALREVERGAVPDAYRDLVRAYFDDDR